tara:strand:+ start:298 stop:813 length:516 start_codon:yes stop_codon:yes gene_type:complete
MISNFKAPDLNAPRYREKVLSLLNADLLKDFKDKYPMYSEIDNSKLKSIINLYNKKLWEEVINSREGVELPDSLGFLFIGSCPAAKSVNTNYALSKEYGKVLQNRNLKTDGKIAKIFYTNVSTKYRFKNRDLWQFQAVRQFKRTVAKTYPDNWPKYIVMESKRRVKDMFKK